jgi:hypothetical protein
MAASKRENGSPRYRHSPTFRQYGLVAAGLKREDVLGKHFAETPWWSQSSAVQQQLREAIVRAARGEPDAGDEFIQAGEQARFARSPNYATRVDHPRCEAAGQGPAERRIDGGRGAI